MHGNPAKEDRKGNFKSGPNGLNKKHPTGVGTTSALVVFHNHLVLDR